MNHRQATVFGIVFGLALLGFVVRPTIAPAQSASKTSSSNLKNSITQSAPEAASAWNGGDNSRVRIISGDTDFTAPNPSYAGIQVQMAKGWKTYWRSPGDSGVPPSFDWSGSKNLKNINILWPAPKKYKDEYSTSIGYKSEVILPLQVTAKNKRKPVNLKLRLGYGICADICVPVEAQLNLTLKPRQEGYGSLLSHYRSMVPKSLKSTGKMINGFSIKKVAVTLKGKKPNIIIDASVPVDTKKAELYVEASNGFYLPFPIGERPSAGGFRRFHIDLTKGDPPKNLVGQTLALTLVGNKKGIEYKHKIN